MDSACIGFIRLRAARSCKRDPPRGSAQSHGAERARVVATSHTGGGTLQTQGPQLAAGVLAPQGTPRGPIPDLAERLSVNVPHRRLRIPPAAWNDLAIGIDPD